MATLKRESEPHRMVVGKLEETQAAKRTNDDEEARREFEDAVARRRERDDPESNTGRGAYVVDLKEAIVAGSRRGILVLYGAVGAVLLIVCANLANLQLAQGVLRQRSLAIQSATQRICCFSATRG